MPSYTARHNDFCGGRRCLAGKGGYGDTRCGVIQRDSGGQLALGYWNGFVWRHFVDL